jgi:hypothetical protein
MILSKLQLDESHEIDFAISITGTTEQTSDVRLFIEGKDYDVVCHGKLDNGNVKFNVPKLKGIIDSGIHECRMEVVIDGKIFTPLKESLEFMPLVEFNIKPTKTETVKEEVTVKPIIKKTKIDEALENGFTIVDYKNNKILKKDHLYWGLVNEKKMVLSDKPASTINELIESL